MKQLPSNSVRGRIRTWIEEHADKLGNDVLEVGSRQHEAAWWVDNRDLQQGRWTGIDMQAGPGVDLVADVLAMPDEWAGRFSGVLCSEVLEHLRYPLASLQSMRITLKPGGWIVVTTLTAFPIHGFPDDYWRFTESGLRLLLEDAGFAEIETGSAGEVHFRLNDHGEPRNVIRACPMHVFAVARRSP